MAEQAERVCAVCENPLDLPLQREYREQLLCSLCLRVARRARMYESRFEVEVGTQSDRPDYDLHPPGLM
jgi:hypothetical protein